MERQITDNKQFLNLARRVIVMMLIIGLGAATVSARQKTITFKKGQRISLISSKLRQGGEEILNEYFQKVFPIATSYGFAQLGALDFKAIKAGDYKPDTFLGIYLWPSRKAENDFENDSRWPELKAMRPLAWEELKINTLDAATDVEWTFKDDKLYHVSFIWINKDNPKDFETYSKGTEITLKKVGAKTIAQLKGGAYESLQDGVISPDYILIVEWPNERSHKAYLKSRAFQKHKPYFDSGVAKLESFETVFQFTDK